MDIPTETLVKQLDAKLACLECVCTQIMLRYARLDSRPDRLVHIVMHDAERNLLGARARTTGEEQAAAQAALDYFAEYSKAVKAALASNPPG